MIPDALSRSFGEIEPQQLPHTPILASFCRNRPPDCLYYPPGPPDYEISTDSWNDVDPVQDDYELLAGDVPLFPVLDPVKLREEQ